MAIKRVWHGWTTKENAEKYQRILQNEVIPGIEAKNIYRYHPKTRNVYAGTF